METKTHLEGHCYCGGFRFSIPTNVSPKVAGYCHCESCSRANSCPLYQVVYIDDVISGHDSAQEFSRSSCNRYFCRVCGSRVFNTLSHRPGWLGIFPALLHEEIQHNLPENLKPTKHFNSEEHILDPDKIDSSLRK